MRRDATAIVYTPPRSPDEGEGSGAIRAGADLGCRPDLDLLGLGVGGLRQRQAENAVLEGRARVIGVDRSRQGDLPMYSPGSISWTSQLAPSGMTVSELFARIVRTPPWNWTSMSSLLQSACKRTQTHERAAGARTTPSVPGMQRRGLGASGTHLRSVRPRLFCFPSSDRVFAAVVEDVASRLALTSPDELMDALRRRYPHTSVRPRQLTGESVTVWYVYRERTFPAHPGDVEDA